MEPQLARILVVEDYPLLLDGIVNLLEKHYPDADLWTASSVRETWAQLELSLPDLVVFDLAIPTDEQDQQQAQPETGIRLLKQIMQHYSQLNIVVQSTYTKALVRIIPQIDEHLGGFTIIEKSRSSQEVLERIESARRGYTNTQEIRKLQSGVEVKPEWTDVLTLAFQEGLQDRAIAQRMNVQIGTIRHYWRKLYDVLEIDPEAERKVGRNLRTVSELNARHKGLID